MYSSLRGKRTNPINFQVGWIVIITFKTGILCMTWQQWLLVYYCETIKLKKKNSSNQQLDILLDLSIIPCKGKKQIFVVMESYRNVQSKNFQCAAD